MHQCQNLFAGILLLMLGVFPVNVLSAPNKSNGIWSSPSEIAHLPMSGPAWDKLKSKADAPLKSLPNLSKRKREGIQVLAKALVYARTGRESYRQEVIDAFNLRFSPMILRFDGADEAEALSRCRSILPALEELVDGENLVGIDTIAGVIPPLEAQREIIANLEKTEPDRLGLRDRFEFALREVIPASEARLRDVELLLETEPAGFRCRPCGHSFALAETRETAADEAEAIHFIPELAHAFLRCPGCGSPDFEVVAGRGVVLQTLEGE